MRCMGRSGTGTLDARRSSAHRGGKLGSTGEGGRKVNCALMPDLPTGASPVAARDGFSALAAPYLLACPHDTKWRVCSLSVSWGAC
eukprot:11136573-Karenia_brevis.AAC.1